MQGPEVGWEQGRSKEGFLWTCGRGQVRPTISTGSSRNVLKRCLWLIPWWRRRQWHPTPVLLPGKSHGWRLRSMGSLRVGYDWATSLTFHFHALEKEMATHSKCSCMQNPRDRRAWWAAVYGVAQSRTRLKWLSSSPGGSDHKESACNAGDPGLIPGLGGSPGEGNGYSLQFLPGEFHRHGQRSPVAPSSCGPKVLDMIKWLTFSFSLPLWEECLIRVFKKCVYAKHLCSFWACGIWTLARHSVFLWPAPSENLWHWIFNELL